MSEDKLEPIEPQEAVELYLNHRERELSRATLLSHKSRLSHFVTWCEDVEETTNLNELTGRKLHRFRLWRRDFNGGIKPVTEKTQMNTLRVFVRFLETVDGVPDGLSDKIQSPDLDNNNRARDVMLTHNRAQEILDYLTKYRYASRPHVVVLLEWATMMRRGAISALDVCDYHSDEEYLAVRHRPDAGTAIKNQKAGERMVALPEEVCTVLDDWLESQRPDISDEFGRNPLVSTPQGRIHPTTITTIVYNWTRPCIIGDPCPLERDPDECDAATYSHASKCPETVSSHAIRRGSITHHLQSDIPKDVVSERADVGADVLDRHYDRRSEKEKMEQRRKHLRNL
jgi:site-specific recombinase XerD